MKACLLVGLIGLSVIALCVPPCLGQSQEPRGALAKRLLALIPYTEKIADFTLIYSDVEGRKSATNNSVQIIEKRWGRGERAKAGALNYPERPADEILTKIWLYPSVEKAEASFQTFVRASSGLSLSRHPAGFTLGSNFRTNGSGLLFFISGRATVLVNVSGSEMDAKQEIPLAEAVARGIEYNLSADLSLTQVMPGRLIKLRTKHPTLPALIIGRNAWAPLVSLEALGVQATRNANQSVTLMYRGRSLVVTPLSSKARQGIRTIDLELPVLLRNEDIVLPITQVAKVLQIPVPKPLQ